MSYDFISSSLKKKLLNLSFMEEEKNILSRSFNYFSSEYIGKQKLEESINFPIRKFLLEKTFTVNDSNIQNMEIKLIGEAKQSNINKEEGWSKPSRRKIFKKPPEKRKMALIKQKKSKKTI